MVPDIIPHKILYPLLETGQYIWGDKPQNPDYECYNYSITPDQSIEIRLTTAELDYFSGDQEEKVKAKTTKLNHMQRVIIQDLEYWH